MFEYAVTTEELPLFIVAAVLDMAVILFMLPLKVRKTRTAMWAVLAVFVYAAVMFVAYAGLLHYFLPDANRRLLIALATGLFTLFLFSNEPYRNFLASFVTFSYVELIWAFYEMLRTLTNLNIACVIGLTAVYLVVETFLTWTMFVKDFRNDLRVNFLTMRTTVSSHVGFIMSLVLFNILMYTGVADTLYGLLSYFAWTVAYVSRLVSDYRGDRLACREKEMQAINSKKEKEYQAFVSSIEVINVKSHDLKKYSQDLKAMNINGMEEYIGELDSALQVYTSISNTGNYELDTILSEKKQECDRNGISFDYVINGEDLGFISGLDMYILFGNAMDNAIEACLKENSDRRIISLNAGRSGGLVFISVENSCSSNPRFKNGAPVTSKEDEIHHGYGSASIRSIARKYGGNAEFSCSKGTFSLNILLPAQPAMAQS
ncbi:MAG: ATP-binding protein [Clostridia bacterium]|nr:ATP-binding protein [Clostridia bacterium]